MIDRRYAGPPPATRLPSGATDTQLHVYQPGFPAQPGGPALPGFGPSGPPDVAAYRQVMARLGLDRCVITQGNAHQRDNANLLEALRLMGDRARGVAVIDAATPEAELARLHAAGVRGARIMDLPGGALGLEALEAVDSRAAAAGWALAVQFDGSDIAAHFDRLMALKSNWIFDHHGKFFRGAAPDGPEIALTRKLLDTGRCWFKFAGCYESSRSGGPDFPDIAANARILAAHAPQRILWGTNFPHNQAQTTAEYPDDAALLDTVLGWLPDDAARRLALVDTPAALFGF